MLYCAVLHCAVLPLLYCIVLCYSAVCCCVLLCAVQGVVKGERPSELGPSQALLQERQKYQEV